MLHNTFTIPRVLLFCVLLTLTASCSKTWDDSTLAGQWRLMSVDYLDATTASPDSTLDASVSGIYWSFQDDLLQITAPYDANGVTAQTFSRYHHDGDSLHILATYAHFRDRDSLLDDTTTALRPLGLPAGRTCFHVDKSQSHHLTLRAKSLQVRLKKTN